MDIYRLREGVEFDLETDDGAFQKLSADFEQVDHELLCGNSVGDKIYWDARLRAIYRGTYARPCSTDSETKPALLMSAGFAFHAGTKRRFKSAQVEIAFSRYTGGCPDGQPERPRIVSFGPRFATGISTPSTRTRSVELGLTPPEPVSFLNFTVRDSHEVVSTNCMRIVGTCRGPDNRLVWDLDENPTAGLGMRGLPAAFEVAFLVVCERACVMSVRVREVKIGWGAWDRERYMLPGYWPVTSFARDFVLDPDDDRHETPPEGIVGDFKAEDVVMLFKNNSAGLIPA
ncbi:hypothetical protein QBC47DRAFT_370548 [Echria macrotheca]|uniref:Uncharacterized protein n=1 Tax=Echria macrotheca TaxID=438768 RepID=A0AAJ0BIW1_9PEZI|nr:hypothetical protein QBC47DRAFT_370548 [Echria macrotheca]